MDKRKLRRNRHFSEQIRRRAVKDFRSGKYTVKQLADLYHCSKQTIYRWIHKYSPADSPSITVVEMSQSKDKKLKEQAERIAELEAAVGRKQIKVDVLEKMVELAEQDYDLDLKKNIGGSRSTGSGSTENR